MSTAVVLGGADCVWCDLDAAMRLGRIDVVVAVNHAGRDYRGRVDHWATFHPELLPTWIEARRALHLPDVSSFWSVTPRKGHPELPLSIVEDWGGSSGLIGAQVALMVASHVVLCGVPLDPDAAHFDKAGRWDEALRHRKTWERRAKSLDRRVRSMSGWTAELLGRPSVEWLAE